MKSLIGLLVLFIVALQCSAAEAGGPCSGVKGGCGRSSYRSSAKTYARSTGTVHVDGYYRKDGTYVRSHTRHAPGTAASSSSPPIVYSDPTPDIPPQPKYRTSARTMARSATWGGTGSAREIDSDNVKAPAARPSIPAKYVVHTTSGRRFEIADYRDDDKSYWFTTISGGGMRYEKSIVARIEPISEP